MLEGISVLRISGLDRQKFVSTRDRIREGFVGFRVYLNRGYKGNWIT